ncbi:MAG: prepilin-type N-terminal cleavage/methylation domain-containing protein [Patescibacteria group bacterium]|nr:prepilin-type N-terminal cleavage/methylation domain-containing protein [Patescibacteria group bacterium]
MIFKNKKASFTLVELIVVVAIIGLLAGIAVAAFNNARVKARDVRRIADISQITKALELSFSFNDSYPNSLGTVCLSVCMDVSPPSWCSTLLTQMSNIPNDPLPTQQCYLYNSDGTNFRIATTLESSSNQALAQNDGGNYAQYFESSSSPGLISLSRNKYASAVGGNWSSDDGAWVTESGGSTITTHPVQGDTAILDVNSGNITVDTASVTTDIDATGYTHTLALDAGLTVYGNLKFVAGMTFTPNTQTVTFAATTTGKTITTGGKTFSSVTWNGNGGEWTLQDHFLQNRVIAFTSGTLIFNGKSYINGSYGNPITLGSGFTLNVGAGRFICANAASLTVPTGATITISTGMIDIINLTVSGTGTFTATNTANIILWGNLDITSSNFDAGLSTIYQKYSTTTRSLSSTQSLYNYTVGTGSGSDYNISIVLQSNLTILNDFAIQYVAGKIRSFDAGSYTINIGGNFTNDDTFTAGTSTVNFNDATKISTIGDTSNTTFNNLTSTTPDKTIKFKAESTTTVTSLSLTGSSGHLITMDTDTGASTFNLSDSAGTNTLYYTSITRSAAAGGATWNALISDGNANGGSNSGWNF